MNTPRFFLAAALSGAAILAALTLVPNIARAQTTATAVTDPVGYLTSALQANSDTLVSIPFTRPAEFTGAVASVSGNVITLASTPGFSPGGLVYGNTASNDVHKTYYVIVGPKSAVLTPTLSVTNGSPTATASATLTEPVVGDTVTVAGYTFTVAVVSGTTLTLDRAFPGTTAGGLAATYNHSPSEGRFYTVTANDAGSLTVNLNGDSLGNVVAGTQVSVIPYWTLGTAFPASDAGTSFFASNSPLIRAMEMQIPNYTQSGINILPAATYYFYNNAWRQFSRPVANSYDDTILLPDGFITVRNNTANTATFKPSGCVFTKRLTVALNSQGNSQQDNLVSLTRPVAVALKDSNLVSSGAFTPSTSPLILKDQLSVFDNNAAGINKLPVATYYYYNAAWRQFGRPVAEDHGSDVLVSGSGFLIRKSAAANTSFWINAPTY